MTPESTQAQSISARELTNRSPMISSTGRRYRADSPQLPWSSCPSQWT